MIIRFLGQLASLFGKEFRVRASSPREAMRILVANNPDLGVYLRRSLEDRGIAFRIFACGHARGMGELDDPVPGERPVFVAPALVGNSGVWGAIGKIVIGGAMIAIGVVTGFAPLIMAGISFVLAGASQLLQALISQKKSNKSSFYFNGILNVSRQGIAIPLAYGRIMCGSVVIAASQTLDNLVRVDPISGSGSVVSDGLI